MAFDNDRCRDSKLDRIISIHSKPRIVSNILALSNLYSACIEFKTNYIHISRRYAAGKLFVVTVELN
jgi:hypothetical protein